ncbi:MAG: hypothetical protein WB998_05965 [Solirubrobacteraceae bacterium]
MASPPYKGGYGANFITAVAPDGNSVAFGSSGAFAGVLTNPVGGTYLGRRDASGWSTAPLEPPASVAPWTVLGGTSDYSATLDASLSMTMLGTNQGEADEEKTAGEFLLHRTDSPYDVASFEIAGLALEPLEAGGKIAIPNYEGASPDLSHIFFTTESNLLPELPEPGGKIPWFYEMIASGAGAPSFKLVGLNNEGGVIGGGSCGAGASLPSRSVSRLNEISANGASVYFRACNSGQLFVRVDARRTLEVSKPLGEVCEEVPCPGSAKRAEAEFQGASEDGSRVYFTTSAPLVVGDHDTQNVLYLASVGCPGGEEACEPAQKVVTQMTQVSRAPSGEAADVRGVVAVSPDGSRVYFVAGGVLSEGANAEGHAPVAGAENLYVYDTSSGEAPVFVADLCSGPELSGVSKDQVCPDNLNINGVNESPTNNDKKLWATAGPEAQTAGADAGFLVFSSFGRLTSGDADGARDIYRYEAASGLLERVSVGEAGRDANGNNSAYSAAMRDEEKSEASSAAKARLRVRAINEDGTRIVFTTAEPLSRFATNGLENVYEWRAGPGPNEGSVSLVSSGSSPESDSEPVITPSGDDVFFVTSQSLLPQDTDSAPDVYDARIGGGFPPVLAERQPCSGDACQGALTNPAPLLVAGSVAQAPGGNFSTPAPAKKVVKAKKKSKQKAKKNKTKRQRRSGTAARRRGRSTTGVRRG